MARRSQCLQLFFVMQRVVFACAANSFAAGLFSVFKSIDNLELAMLTFSCALFLMCLCGLVMDVLDAPIPQVTLHTCKYAMGARLIMFKLFLFLTHFTERSLSLFGTCSSAHDLGRAL